MATGGYKGHIKIWDSFTGEEARSIEAHHGAVLSIAYSSDGRWIATSGEDQMVKIWEAKTGQEIGELEGVEGAVRFSPDGDLLAINRGSHVEIWQVEVRKAAPSATLSLQFVEAFLLPYFRPGWWIEPSISFSPDGNTLAASLGAMVLYDVPNRRRLLRVILTGDILHDVSSNDAVRAVAFSPGGEFLATGTNQSVYLLPTRSD